MEILKTMHSSSHDVNRSPNYRVHFWEKPDPSRAWVLYAFIIRDAKDFWEVHAWASKERNSRELEIFVETDVEEFESGHSRTVGLIRLFGSDPNAVGAPSVTMTFTKKS